MLLVHTWNISPNPQVRLEQKLLKLQVIHKANIHAHRVVVSHRSLYPKVEK